MRGVPAIVVICFAAVVLFGASLQPKVYAQQSNQVAPAAPEPSAPSEAPDAADAETATDSQATYYINPLDRLLIVVYAGEKQYAQHEKYVQSDGTVYLPYLEMDVKIGGLMLIDAQQKIEDLSRKIVLQPRVVITLMTSVTQNVSTYGKISNRTIDISTPMRVLQLIARAGGPTEGAIEDSIRVISTDGTVRLFNYKKVNGNPNLTDNFPLKPGDIVFVPGADDFSIMVFGDVRNTGLYRMKTGDRVLDALLRAGSWQTTANLQEIRLLRVIGRNRVEPRHLDLRKLFDLADTSQNLVLQNGDIIFIPTTTPSNVSVIFTAVLNTIYTILLSYSIYLNLKN